MHECVLVCMCSVTYFYRFNYVVDSIYELTRACKEVVTAHVCGISKHSHTVLASVDITAMLWFWQVQARHFLAGFTQTEGVLVVFFRLLKGASCTNGSGRSVL